MSTYFYLSALKGEKKKWGLPTFKKGDALLNLDIFLFGGLYFDLIDVESQHAIS